MTHWTRNGVNSETLEKCDGSIAPCRHIWDSVYKLQRQMLQQVNIKGPFWRSDWCRRECANAKNSQSRRSACIAVRN